MKARAAGTKGQEEAPFALFLAVAMLALLLPIAAELYKNASTAVCEEQIQSSMETLARDIEIGTALPGNNTVFNVDFGFFSCGNWIISNFTLKSPGSEECVRSCQTANCMMVRGNGYVGEEPTVIGEPVCVRLPLDVNLRTSGCTGFGYTGLPSNTFNTTKYTLVLVKKEHGGLTDLHLCNYNS
ncbi:MAG: hypothetical protein J7L23_03265 [Candidatus Diapherotrites archaeon]|nr:hypothetical protein [Candidatus Diapherotrites archaeon]